MVEALNSWLDKAHARVDISLSRRGGPLRGSAMPVDASSVFGLFLTAPRLGSRPRGGWGFRALQQRQRVSQTVRVRARTSCTGRRRPAAKRTTACSASAGSEPPGEPEPASSEAGAQTGSFHSQPVAGVS